jgi:hypothetical protein
MRNRKDARTKYERGPRWGWTGGFLGATCRIPILSRVLLYHHDTAGGAAGLLLFASTLSLAFFLRPWKHPDTAQWMLYLGAISPVFLAAGFLTWRYGIYVNPEEQASVGLYAAFPLVLPAFILGGRTWKEMSRPRP